MQSRLRNSGGLVASGADADKLLRQDAPSLLRRRRSGAACVVRASHQQQQQQQQQHQHGENGPSFNGPNRRGLLAAAGVAAAGLAAGAGSAVVLPPPASAGSAATAAAAAAADAAALPAIPTVALTPRLSVSRVIKGCWQLSGGHRGERASDRTGGREAVADFGEFAANGVTTFDMAGEPIWSRTELMAV